MKFKKIHLFLVFLVVLGGLYVINIFNINKVANLVVVKPVSLSFVVITPNKLDCGDCFDAQNIISIIKKSHDVKISNTKMVTPSSSTYRELIKKYKIKNLPAIVISGEVLDKRIIGAWKSFASENIKNNIVIQNLLPYYDIASKRAKGFVTAVVLEDNTCKDCFSGMDYIKMIKQRSITIKKYKILDISTKEGSSLVKKYKITKIPTIVLSPEVNDYPGFANSWNEVGTMEKDGSFVLREVQKVAVGLKFKKI